MVVQKNEGRVWYGQPTVDNNNNNNNNGQTTEHSRLRKLMWE